MTARIDSLARLPAPLQEAVGGALQTATWTSVKRALSAFANCPIEQQGPEVAVHILSSFNLEPIEPALRLGLRCIPTRATLEIAPLNAIEQQIFEKTSAVYSGKFLANVILWRIEELFPELLFPYSSGGAKDQIHRTQAVQERIRKLAQVYLETASTPLFVCTIPLPSAHAGAVLHGQFGAGLSSAVARINSTIFELPLLDPRIRVIDLNSWAAEQGAATYDSQMDFVGRQPLTVRGAISLGLLFARHLRPLVTPRKKVLAVDLDNTLWGGILGEDGAPNLKIGNDFPGNVYLRIQRELRELKHQGVLLLLLSKNEEQDVRKAFESIPDMLLKWDDFVCHKINFEHKYLNLRQAAAELSLGLDSFAVLDDSDYEREQIKTFLPEVCVLNSNSGALHMLECLLRTEVFDTYQVSEEDQSRHQDYQLRAARTISPDAGDVEQFLGSLGLKAIVAPINETNMERVVQMFGKTNQFNLTTRRHRVEDLRRMLSLANAVGLTLRLSDKFGDQGIVGVLVAVPEKDRRTMSVDSFLISCRAIGRGVEEVLWASLVNRVIRAGLERISGEYIATSRNPVVATLYDRLGMKCVEKSDSGSRYCLEKLAPVSFPAYIAVEETA